MLSDGTHFDGQSDHKIASKDARLIILVGGRTSEGPCSYS
jgi:hypothetical protein